jgi:hypothetical protein
MMDAAGSPAIHVNYTRDGLWEIREQERQLAAFGDEDDACAYADGIARVREGARIFVNGQARWGNAAPRIAPG